MNEEESKYASQYRLEHDRERANYYQRLQEFPWAIRELGQTNAAVNNIISLYTYGDILTREEALCQMVVALAKDWRQEADRAFREYSTLMNATVFSQKGPGQ